MSLFERPERTRRCAKPSSSTGTPHNWSNRLIAGDSLLVMNSLLEKEGMAGKVQMIYVDPPYGIRYGSNFQPFVNRRDVKDGKDEDLTPGAGDDQGVPRHVGTRHSLVPHLPA